MEMEWVVCQVAVPQELWLPGLELTHGRHLIWRRVMA